MKKSRNLKKKEKKQHMEMKMTSEGSPLNTKNVCPFCLIDVPEFVQYYTHLLKEDE